MTNYEMIQTLDSKELAWFLMNNTTASNGWGCGVCINKQWSEECGNSDCSCIEGHRQFLEREVTDEDMVMYLIAHNNAVIDVYNAMPEPDRNNYRVDYREFNGKKYANVISLIDTVESPFK